MKFLSVCRPIRILAVVVCCLSGAGCGTPGNVQVAQIAQTDIPRELDKASIPVYRIEPPDILLIEAVNNIRLPETPLRAGDQLIIRASNVLPIDPEAEPIENEFKILNGIYMIQANGMIDLGPEYGTVRLGGLTLEQAREAIDHHLQDVIGLEAPKVAVTMPDIAGKQAIAGEHLVEPDGAVSLGIYGRVYVAGMTVEEARQAIEAKLTGQINDPEIRVSVVGFNSKVIYVITDGGGYGEGVVRLPYTGNETVLDAIAQINGLSDISSKSIWVARPSEATAVCAQTMAVDWRGITQDGMTATNYQLFPGDRIYIKADSLITLDNVIGKVTAPVERIFGVILLGQGTVQRLESGAVGTGFGGFGI